MTTAVLNTKTSVVKNKIPVVSDLGKKIDYNAKISEIEGKYFSTSDYNKFTSDILDVKIKQKELVNKSDISNLGKNSDFNTKLAILVTKAGLKVEQDKIVKLKVFDSSCFRGKFFLMIMAIKICLFISQHVIR